MLLNKEKSSILVPLALSPHSKYTFDVAFEMAKLFGVDLIVLHVVHDPFGTESLRFPYVYVKEEERERYREKVAKELHEFAEKKKDSSVPIKELTCEGDPTQKILDLIREENVFTLVLGHHLAGWLNHMLLGHDTIRLAERAPCNVMLVHLSKAPPKR